MQVPGNINPIDRYYYYFHSAFFIDIINTVLVRNQYFFHFLFLCLNNNKNKRLEWLPSRSFFRLSPPDGTRCSIIFNIISLILEQEKGYSLISSINSWI